MGCEVVPESKESCRRGGALRAVACRLWGICSLVALAAAGLAGWFVIVTLPLLGLFVFAALLVGWVSVKTLDVVQRALPSRAGKSHRGTALASD